MKKNLIAILLFLLFCEKGYADSYYFKECKLSNAVSGDYIINFDQNVIEVSLRAVDGTAQNFSDKIKLIEKNKIVSEKIKSARGENIYYQYFLNSESNTVVKLQYKKESGIDMDIYRLQQKKLSYCSDIKVGWDKDKIEKAEMDKEELQIAEAQEKLKKEQSSIIECEGSEYKNWNNCTGTHKLNTGHTYSGFYLDGKIIEGTALFPGGSKYVGEFKNFKPHGYGNFAWSNGDKYFGEWREGKNHGNGTKVWNDGREYLGDFKNDKLHGVGTLYYPDGKKYVGEFINGKRHGEGTFTYPDGTAFIGKFIAGQQQGLGECIAADGSSIPCEIKTDTQAKDFSGKDTKNISIEAKKWVRVSQYETNTKKGKKIMDQLKADFDSKALELCSQNSNYKVLEKKIEIIDIDETPAYGLETKLKIGITGAVECK